jgi:hypothetical protein
MRDPDGVRAPLTGIKENSVEDASWWEAKQLWLFISLSPSETRIAGQAQVGVGAPAWAALRDQVWRPARIPGIWGSAARWQAEERTRNALCDRMVNGRRESVRSVLDTPSPTTCHPAQTKTAPPKRSCKVRPSEIGHALGTSSDVSSCGACSSPRSMVATRGPDRSILSARAIRHASTSIEALSNCRPARILASLRSGS